MDTSHAMAVVTPAPATFMVDRTWIDDAVLEAIEQLPAEHKSEVMKRFETDPGFRSISHAVVMFTAVQSSMAAMMTEDQETFRRMAVSERPEFADDFDAILLAKAILEDIREPIETELLVTKAVYQDRIDLLQQLFNH